MNPPTAAEPWTVTLAWTPDQNNGRVSIMPRRTPLMAIIDLIGASETRTAVAAEYDLTVTEVAVLDQLYEEFRERQRDIDMENWDPYA